MNSVVGRIRARNDDSAALIGASLDPKRSELGILLLLKSFPRDWILARGLIDRKSSQGV
jgi:hypothetical protein